MSLRENVSRHSTHMYGRSPVSARFGWSICGFAGKGKGQGRDGSSLTSKEMALQVLCVEISLGAVGTRELSISILLGNLGLSRTPRRRGSGSAGGAGQDAPTTLRTDNVSRLLSLRKHARLRHQRALRIGRVHTRLRRHHTTGGHGAQDWRHPTARRWSRRDRLRVGHGRGGRLRQHGGRGRVGLRGLLVRVASHHRVRAPSSVLGRWRRVRGHTAVGNWGVRCGWSARRVRVTGIRVVRMLLRLLLLLLLLHLEV